MIETNRGPSRRIFAVAIAFFAVVGGTSDANADPAPTADAAFDGAQLVTQDFTLAVSPNEVRVLAVDPGPAWAWSLAQVTVGGQAVALDPVPELVAGGDGVDIDRGALVEQYLRAGDRIEQRFVVPAPLGEAGADLRIDGRVDSDAIAMIAVPTGHVWHDGDRAVRMGDVTVFDATGRTLRARLDVEPDETHIVVDGRDLAQATWPVTIDPEIGVDDFRISQMGRDGSTAARASDPAVAYSVTSDRWLVVWQADDGDETADDEFEIFGQLHDRRGRAVSERIRISNVGPAGDADFDAVDPAVAWDATSDQFAVVWSGDASPGEDEIYARRLDGATGRPLGSVTRVTRHGADGDTAIDAVRPTIAAHPTAGEWMIAWAADAEANGEQEVYARRLASDGTLLDGRATQVTRTGVEGDTTLDADAPSVAWDPNGAAWVVAFESDPLVDGDQEIYAQRLTTEATLSGGPVRISVMGEDGDTTRDAFAPSVAWDAASERLVFAWHGDNDADGDIEIHAATLGARGATSETIRVTDTGERDDRDRRASNAEVAIATTDGEVIVVFDADVDAPGARDIWVVGLGEGLRTTRERTRISSMGDDRADPTYEATDPVLAYAARYDTFFIAWRGDDDTAPLSDEDDEIFGQLWGDAEPSDSDGDGIVDAEDPCPRDPDNDVDTDGVCGDVDNCPTTRNATQLDSDEDGLGDACDGCPDEPADTADGCPGGGDTGMDAGMDAGSDAGMDAGMDAGSDAGGDAGSDAGGDAGSDTGTDAGSDVGDTGSDAGEDAGGDVGADATTDADAGEDATGDASGDASGDPSDTATDGTGSSDDTGSSGDTAFGGGGSTGCAAAPRPASPGGAALLAMALLLAGPRRRR